MEIYKYKDKIFLKVSCKNYLPIIFYDNYDEDKDYICVFLTDNVVFTSKMMEEEKMELYELSFNKTIKNKLVEFEKYIPNDIVKNCMKCNYYSSCKYEKGMLKDYEETNKILKEYKNFIKSIKDDDLNENI